MTFANRSMRCFLQDQDDETYNALINAEIMNLRGQINDAAVCALASSLNSGKSCIIQHSRAFGSGHAIMGCANYHARIVFSDGSPSWLIRVPRVTGFAVGFPTHLAEALIRSEYATLKFLETTAVPAPRAFSYGIPSLSTDRDVGVCFLLMEEMPGRPWNGQGDRAKVWKGLTEILGELARHPFPMAGSLYVDSLEDTPFVSTVASDRFVVLDPWGPFGTAAAYYAGWAEQYLALIADGQLYPQFPVEAYLVYRFLKDAGAQQLTDPTENELFFLKHVDDKGDHLMVDDEFNITGIIDWQMARIVPRREAFGPSLVSADMRALCGGGNGVLGVDDVALGNALCERRNESPNLANCLRWDDEKARRFFWGLGLEGEWKHALPLAETLLRVFGVEAGWEEWKQKALADYGDDERLRLLLRR
ncbi:hypothetical protein B0T19DRAFT_465062 [Cercophora scortea]|uniref:Aminoglycoside phosphotransferase domain-containing protein n=1 Tax=Cercophora scortea TaxID=314031 RepID=A0AAE0IHH7_9PEZI|nr:hypothetical protein B0T19DRAFT_465062 [Cercophora scortea]